jgi:small subunit ribosomal protein S16
VAVKIRLKRMGKIRTPYYRVVVVDARKKRDGRVIEQIGKYHPKEEPSFIEVTSERAQYWLGVGAQPTEAVEALLKITGDWQRFKGLPGAEGTLRTAEVKKSKQDRFNEALKEAGSEPQTEAVTAKKATSKKAAEKAPVEKAPVEKAPVEKAPVEKAPVEEAADRTPGVETPEGATEQAEAEEAKTVDAEQQSDAAPDNTPPTKTDDGAEA